MPHFGFGGAFRSLDVGAGKGGNGALDLEMTAGVLLFPAEGVAVLFPSCCEGEELDSTVVVGNVDSK